MISIFRKYFSFSQPVKWVVLIFLLIMNFMMWALFFGVPFLKLQPFCGTFAGSFLGFLIALLLDRRNEERIEAKKRSAEKEELKKEIDLVIAELIFNKAMVEDIGKYIFAVTSRTAQDFKNRDKDYLFHRLQISSKEAVWKKLLEGISDTKLVIEVGVLYEDFVYLNNLLEQLCTHITSSLRTGSIHQDYKMAIATSPWEMQLTNELSKILDECDRMIKGLTEFKNNIR